MSYTFGAAVRQTDTTVLEVMAYNLFPQNHDSYQPMTNFFSKIAPKTKKKFINLHASSI
ncbi:MAG: hypothetical protein AAF518_22900 [Spirochaetota bacterium]